MRNPPDRPEGSGTAPWYQNEPDDVLAALKTRATGLTDAEARERLATCGYNELTVRKRSVLVRFLLQFHNAMIYILLEAAAVTGLLLHELVDTLVILGVEIEKALRVHSGPRPQAAGGQ